MDQYYDLEDKLRDQCKEAMKMKVEREKIESDLERINFNVISQNKMTKTLIMD